MKTDVIALDTIVAEAAKADGSLLSGLDELSVQSIDLRVDTELTPDEVRAIADAALAEYSLLMVEREAEPHVIHQAKAIDKTEASGLRYVGLIDCPDCTRGLVSRGGVMVCVQAGRFDTSKLKEGDVVACGKTR